LVGAVIPASIHPYNLNRGSGGFGCSTAFLASAVTLPSEALTVAGLGDDAACCAYAEPEKDPCAANAMTPAKARRLNDFNLFVCFMILARFRQG
jgi:hypothetical protein